MGFGANQNDASHPAMGKHRHIPIIPNIPQQQGVEKPANTT
jgi:hypothetical protein